MAAVEQIPQPPHLSCWKSITVLMIMSLNSAFGLICQQCAGFTDLRHSSLRDAIDNLVCTNIDRNSDGFVKCPDDAHSCYASLQIQATYATAYTGKEQHFYTGSVVKDCHQGKPHKTACKPSLEAGFHCQQGCNGDKCNQKFFSIPFIKSQQTTTELMIRYKTGVIVETMHVKDGNKLRKGKSNSKDSNHAKNSSSRTHTNLLSIMIKLLILGHFLKDDGDSVT
ncbi:uncharacterized protein LOC106177540 [Lingula anatina]|uniref:Uncharacterized protein LOC106177540 n=1 Tax=Lingula anatina TaxID=7574 RepID=A0A1S3JZI5_LINAN|nr:uncharacterized protein LOC106177540 [Lingula anatina]|eukprot:XP_013415808.1 uncharacterized protein LOC106177540 [Lingula anatina]